MPKSFSRLFQPEEVPKGRFVFIDGLRAIAALLVMNHHFFFSELQAPLESIFPSVVKTMLSYGVDGVQIFFVISGFVIAHSLRHTVVTAFSAGNFIVRRQIRLDPAYWFCVIGSSLLIFGRSRVHPVYLTSLPSLKTVLLNMTYLQLLDHAEVMLPVSWTLCLEVQFYLVYILILFLVQRMAARAPGQPHRRALCMAILLFPLLAFSLRRHVLWHLEGPLFIETWYLFALGVFAAWTIDLLMPAPVLFAAVALALSANFRGLDHRVIAGCVTTAAIYAASISGGLCTWLGNRVVQYLGRLSYCIYLVHWDLGKSVLRFGIRLTGMSKWPAFGWFIAANLVCIAAAHLLHVAIERPSMAFASRFKDRTYSSGAPAAGPLN